MHLDSHADRRHEQRSSWSSDYKVQVPGSGGFEIQMSLTCAGSCLRDLCDSFAPFAAKSFFGDEKELKR